MRKTNENKTIISKQFSLIVLSGEQMKRDARPFDRKLAVNNDAVVIITGTFWYQ